MDLAATGWESSGNEERRRTERVLLGVALSVLVHAALLTAWRGGKPVALPEPPHPLTVRVQPPPAPPPVEALEPPPPAPAPARKPERPARAAKPRAPPVIAVPPGAERAGEPDPFVVDQPATPPAPAETPRFDPEAAKRTARSLANMRDPAKEGTAVGQFPEKPLETESRAARAIGAAKRRDCKDGIPGGLLAPLLLALDKKDSGCQW